MLNISPNPQKIVLWLDGLDWIKKAIKQAETAWNSRITQFLQYEIDFEILIQEFFNERDQDSLNLALMSLNDT